MHAARAVFETHNNYTLATDDKTEHVFSLFERRWLLRIPDPGNLDDSMIAHLFDRCQIVILRLLLFCLSSSNVVTSFSAPTPLTAERLQVVCESNIGYTNAHRFIETHYSDHPLVALYQKGGKKQLFWQVTSDSKGTHL